jgi:AraC-type DNA-binding domain-containing proteins
MLSTTLVPVDQSNRELTQHGTAAYPVAVYLDDLRYDVIDWHWHEDLEIGWVKDGCVFIQTNGEEYALQTGDGFFVNSEILHRMENTSVGSACVMPNVVFHPSLISGDQSSAIWQKYVRPILTNRGIRALILRRENEKDQPLLGQIQQAWQANVDDAPGFELRTHMALAELLFLINQRTIESSGEVLSPNQREETRIKQMLDFIHGAYAEPLTLDEIAKSAAISASEAMRCFRRMLKTTPNQYLIQYRLQRAAQLLRETHMPAADIGDQCGFSSPSYFTKRFREKYGQAPSEWRKPSARD